MRSFYLYLLLLCSYSEINAQKQDNIWMYGQKSTISIAQTTSIIFNQDSFSTEITNFEGAFSSTSSSICSPSGNLAFYSNGINIYNKKGVIMDNGDTINGPANDYWFNNEPFGYGGGYFTIPMSYDTNIYYLMHSKLYNDQIAVRQGFRDIMYSKVDMSLNNGLGRVVEKNVILMSDIRFERSCAVRHGNGRDWWYIVPHDLKPYYYRFLITPEGIQGPYEQYDPNKLIDSTKGSNHISKFSPDGKKFIHYHATLGVWVYDFDRCTGEVSNPIHIPFPTPLPFTGGWSGYNFEVSPNSRFLYIVVQGFTQIIQYDLLADDIPASGLTVSTYDGFVHWGGQSTVFGMIQLAPNGKIYIEAGSCDLLHVINHPNLLGTSCDVVQRAIQLPTWNLASLPYFPNYRLYDLPASPCDTLGIDTPISTIQQPDIPLVEGLLYPNPAQEQASLYLPGWQGTGRVTITDALGRVVLEQVVSRDRTTFQVRNWPSGIYAVLVWKEGRLVAAEQLVVQQ